jgi:glycosyltransferase involved in cell wall biosynthesis
VTRAPAVSVLLPTFERRDYVCRAVRSVFAQRYTDWELIVVDDGSTDGTEEALRSFGPRLRYLRQENRGASAARNTGLRLAGGELVAFLDSDDRWLPDHLETVVAMLAQHPEAVLACTTPRFRVQGRKEVSQAEVVDALPLLLVENWIGYPSGTAVRREHLAAVGGFDEQMVVLEDGELWLRLATWGPFSFLQRRTIVRQVTSGSLRDRGSRSGHYFRAIEQMAHSAATQVAQLRRPDAPALLTRAEGTLRYSQALRALAGGDEEAARFGLREACRRLPELSHEPWFFDRRLKLLAAEPAQRLEHYVAAGRLWPDPRCDTALFLRAQGALMALALGQGRRAFALFPARAVPGLAVRQRRLLALLLRRRLQGYLHRGRDAPQALPST